MPNFVILGSGVAAHRAIATLRRASAPPDIVVVSAEEFLPYDRTVLSKSFLKQGDEALIWLENPSFYDGVMIHRRTAASAIDRERRLVVVEKGKEIPYDRLLIATGSRNRRLDLLSGLNGVHYLRTLHDAARLREKLLDSIDVLIVGGGFIGLEVAVTAREMARSVTVVEAAERLLNRCGSNQLSYWALDFHQKNGTDIRLGTQIVSARGDAGRTAVTLTDGQVLSVDLILVCVGILPNQELAQAAGLAVDDGILVDAQCRTSDPDIFAAGEVTRYPIKRMQVRMRTESWTAAGDQAGIAARAMLGEEAIYSDMPWLWSDQGPHNIQSWGFPSLAAQKRLYGEADRCRWIEVGLDHSGTVVSAVALDMGRDISMIRRAEKARRPVLLPNLPTL